MRNSIMSCELPVATCELRGWRGSQPATRNAQLSWTHQREKNYIPDRRRIRQHHRQPIDPDAFAAGGRHAVLQRADVVLVHLHRLLVAARALGALLDEAAHLLVRVVELGKGVGDLHAGDVQLKTLYVTRIVAALL